jgi:hypothetical protein
MSPPPDEIRAVSYDGFRAPMDTFKEHAALEASYRSGVSPLGVVARPPARSRTADPARGDAECH